MRLLPTFFISLPHVWQTLVRDLLCGRTRREGCRESGDTCDAARTHPVPGPSSRFFHYDKRFSDSPWTPAYSAMVRPLAAHACSPSLACPADQTLDLDRWLLLMPSMLVTFGTASSPTPDPSSRGLGRVVTLVRKSRGCGMIAADFPAEPI